jgi:ribonuclease BN (tRNA processing enzyme)
MIDASRRRFVLAAVGAAAGALVSQSVLAQRSSTRVVLLGTGGGPRPRANAISSSQVLVIAGRAYVVDCGDGVARQLAAAKIPLSTLRHVFLTHHHSDHNADYGNLLWLAWAAGLKTPVDTWGPPPLDEMTRLFFQMNAYDINTRIADEGRPPLAPLIRVHERAAGGVVMEDDAVKVTAALVAHPPVTPAFAYRFDAADRSVVFSGDTVRSEALVRLATGADVLVHEALYVPAVDRLVARTANAPTLKKHILESHTSAEDCGRVAAAAGVKTLVLSHLVPADDPEVTDGMWLRAAQAHFRGTVLVAKDLMEL